MHQKMEATHQSLGARPIISGGRVGEEVQIFPLKVVAAVHQVRRHRPQTEVLVGKVTGEKTVLNSVRSRKYICRLCRQVMPSLTPSLTAFYCDEVMDKP
jgi:hypothetical protein